MLQRFVGKIVDFFVVFLSENSPFSNSDFSQPKFSSEIHTKSTNDPGRMSRVQEVLGSKVIGSVGERRPQGILCPIISRL